VCKCARHFLFFKKKFKKIHFAAAEGAWPSLVTETQRFQFFFVNFSLFYLERNTKIKKRFFLHSREMSSSFGMKQNKRTESITGISEG